MLFVSVMSGILSVLCALLVNTSANCTERILWNDDNKKSKYAYQRTERRKLRNVKCFQGEDRSTDNNTYPRTQTHYCVYSIGDTLVACPESINTKHPIGNRQ